jgi:hypothetical protein
MGNAVRFILRAGRETSIITAMKRRANWLGWSLHFMVGLVVGAFVGVFFVMPDWGAPTGCFAPHLVPYWLMGTSLFVGGLASEYGDRLWPVGEHIIPPDAPRHNQVSLFCSLAAGTAGAVLMVYAVGRNLGWV